MWLKFCVYLKSELLFGHHWHFIFVQCYQCDSSVDGPEACNDDAASRWWVLCEWYVSVMCIYVNIFASYQHETSLQKLERTNFDPWAQRIVMNSSPSYKIWKIFGIGEIQINFVKNTRLKKILSENKFSENTISENM